ncbi:MAG: peptidoglycan recognition family protein [Bacteroidota bacterium]
MPRPFHSLQIQDFQQLLAKFPFARTITEVHMHHTWIPDHDSDRGLASVEAMWRYHTQTLRWSDIAQHLTIDKQGTLWTGRNLNVPPASAGGFNGNRQAGPFMFEMIGNFDHGHDLFEGDQRQATLLVIALVQRRFDLPPEALRFHNEMSSKTCPGTTIDKRRSWTPSALSTMRFTKRSKTMDRSRRRRLRSWALKNVPSRLAQTHSRSPM